MKLREEIENKFEDILKEIRTNKSVSTVKKEEFIMSTVEIFQGKTLQVYRFNVIRDIVTSTTSIVIKPKCIAWYNDTTTFLLARLMREEIKS